MMPFILATAVLIFAGLFPIISHIDPLVKFRSVFIVIIVFCAYAFNQIKPWYISLVISFTLLLQPLIPVLYFFARNLIVFVMAFLMVLLSLYAFRTSKRSIKVSVLVFVFIQIVSLYIQFNLMFLQPFAGEITQDRPLMRRLCELQDGCRITVGPYYCIENPESYSDRSLMRWKGFHGCNSETIGYENGYVTIEACSCGGY